MQDIVRKFADLYLEYQSQRQGVKSEQTIIRKDGQALVRRASNSFTLLFRLSLLQYSELIGSLAFQPPIDCHISRNCINSAGKQQIGTCCFLGGVLCKSWKLVNQWKRGFKIQRERCMYQQFSKALNNLTYFLCNGSEHIKSI